MTVVVVCLALTGPSWGADWDGGGGANNTWNEGTNWNPDGVPTDSVTIGGGFSAVLQNAVPSTGRLRVNGGADLTIKTGANLEFAGNFEVGKGGSAGTVLHEDGILKMTSGSDFYLGDDGGSHGTYTMKDGSLTLGDDMKIGNEGPGEFYLQGGTLVVGDYIGISTKSSAVGLFEISGGSVTADELRVGDDRDGTLRIIGDDATITNVGSYSQRSDSTLELIFKDGGISTINCNSMSLAGTLDVSLDAGFTPTPGDYDLFVAGSSTATTFDFVSLPLGGDWSLTYPDKIVRLTYVPEPATMCLLAFGGLALIRRKRRRTR